jgi:hypothetical protein
VTGVAQATRLQVSVVRDVGVFWLVRLFVGS